MRIKHEEENSDGSRTLWLLPDDGKVPLHQKGQYVAVELQDIPGIGDTMTTAFIDEASSTELRLRFPNKIERATQYIAQEGHPGAVLRVGMPCGVPSL